MNSDKNDILFSLSSFLFEDNYSSQSVSFEKFCSIAHWAGYKGVELRETQVSVNTPAGKRKELAMIMHDNDLVLTCLTARNLPVVDTERADAFLRHLDLCQEMGCSLLKISGDTFWLKCAAEKAKKYRIKLATNNHIGSMLETIDGAKQYFSEIADEDFGLLYDSFHLYASGQDYVRGIDVLFERICNVLFHSIRPAKKNEHPIFEKNGTDWINALPEESGVQNWRGIFQRLKQLKYKGRITVIESDWPSEKREFMANHCSSFIIKLWNSV